MYRPHLSLATVLIAATATLAQTGPQADQLPACIETCDPAAIASVDCTNEDQHCHCIRQDGILANITACAQRSCDKPDDDIRADGRIVFTQLFDEACQQFNMTVPATEEHESSDSIHETTERWSNNYGNSGGSGGYSGSGGNGGGGGGWQRGAANSVNPGNLLEWTFGSVACAITLNMMV